MQRVSLRTQIAAVIAFMLLVMTGLGLLTVRSMQAINAYTEEVAINWLPSVRVLGDLRADINLYRIALRAHVMAETAEDKDAAERLSGILDSIGNDRKKYDQQASHGTQQVSADITDVQRGAGQTELTSSQVLSAAQSLSGDSNRLKLEVGRFLQSVRAA